MNNINEDLKYTVELCYGEALYHTVSMYGSELIAMLRFIKSYNAKYYQIGGRLFNLDRYYNITWMQEL